VAEAGKKTAGESPTDGERLTRIQYYHHNLRPGSSPHVDILIETRQTRLPPGTGAAPSKAARLNIASAAWRFAAACGNGRWTFTRRAKWKSCSDQQSLQPKTFASWKAGAGGAILLLS
jgi:hypothetical protein